MKDLLVFILVKIITRTYHNCKIMDIDYKKLKKTSTYQGNSQKI